MLLATEGVLTTAAAGDMFAPGVVRVMITVRVRIRVRFMVRVRVRVMVPDTGQ